MNGRALGNSRLLPRVDKRAETFTVNFYHHLQSDRENGKIEQSFFEKVISTMSKKAVGGYRDQNSSFLKSENKYARTVEHC